jgi:hypothetical protein
MVDHEHAPRVLDGGIGPGDVPHVARKRRRQAALPGPGVSPPYRAKRVTTSFLWGEFLDVPHGGAHAPHLTKSGQEPNGIKLVKSLFLIDS